MTCFDATYARRIARSEIDAADMRIILDKTMKTEYNKGMSEAPKKITMEEVREAHRNGQLVRFGANGPTRILSKEESEKARAITAEKNRQYEAFMKELRKRMDSRKMTSPLHSA